MASRKFRRGPSKNETRPGSTLWAHLGLLACAELVLGCSGADHTGNSDTTSSSESSSTTSTGAASNGATAAGGTSSVGASSSTGETSSGGSSTGGLDAGPAYLKASNADPGDLFGVSLALSGDGNLLGVGANREASSAAAGEGDNSTPDSGAVYLFARSASGWQQQAYLKASNAGEGDAFGSVIALSADQSTLAVGAPFEASSATGVDGAGDDDSAQDAGAVYVFSHDGESWQQQAYLKASYTDEDDHFGVSVALSADGNTLAVGAEGEDSASPGIDGDPIDKSADEAGAVYLFRRTETSWEPSTYFKASNAEAFDHFGSSVALSADGNTLAVGARSEDSASSGVEGDQTSNAASSAGAAYVFGFDGSTWEQETYLKPTQNDAYASDSFGSVVSLSGDGNVLAVGAPGDASAATGVNGEASSDTLPYAGAAYLFTRSGSGWAQQAYLKASNTDAADEFGHDIELSEDGTLLAVGAALEASSASGVEADQGNNAAPEAGAAYLFGSEGTSWRQLAFIKAPNTDAGDRFGWSVSLSAEAAVLAIGAEREASAAAGESGDQTDNSAAQAGAVYVYGDVSLFRTP